MSIQKVDLVVRSNAQKRISRLQNTVSNIVSGGPNIEYRPATALYSATLTAAGLNVGRTRSVTWTAQPGATQVLILTHITVLLSNMIAGVQGASNVPYFEVSDDIRGIITRISLTDLNGSGFTANYAVQFIVPLVTANDGAAIVSWNYTFPAISGFGGGTISENTNMCWSEVIPLV